MPHFGYGVNAPLLKAAPPVAHEYNDCTTCQTLQSDHSKALRAFSKVLQERREAIANGDYAITAKQRDTVMAADAICIKARKRLQRHKAKEHPPTKS